MSRRAPAAFASKATAATVVGATTKTAELDLFLFSLAFLAFFFFSIATPIARTHRLEPEKARLMDKADRAILWRQQGEQNEAKESRRKGSASSAVAAIALLFVIAAAVIVTADPAKAA